MSRIDLQSLTPREAVTDALYRAVLGFDSNDWLLVESAFLDGNESSFDNNGDVLVGKEAIKKLFDFIGPLDTTHTVTNIRVDVEDGASTAKMTAHAVAQHFRKGEGKDPATRGWLAGGLYTIECVKDKKDGLWKVKSWVLKTVWREGDKTVLGRS